ncbi:MAG: biotin synthase BioB [Firmicutes bacterium]|jgi:biotin synthase|nr:biotin synthase BioB [Bacillota bacterium]
MIKQYHDKILRGGQLIKEELMELSKAPLETLGQAANQLRQETCGSGFDICSIINGKSGRCPEDCKYCAQSIRAHADIEEYPLVSSEKIIKEARYNQEKGVLRFSIVTSGKRLSDEEVDRLCETYQAMREQCGISLCASHGLLTENQFRKLKKAGVSRYHNNLETSRRFFPQICGTHSYDNKIQTIRMAQAAGLTVCSGGIIGMGETMEDRIDLALELRELGIKSIPINILNPIPGTLLEHQTRLSAKEVCQTVALFRFALPDAAIRLAGGRGLLVDQGKCAFCSGANAAISGDMLTTAGINIKMDIEMVESLGFEVKPHE